LGGKEASSLADAGVVTGIALDFIARIAGTVIATAESAEQFLQAEPGQVKQVTAGTATIIAQIAARIAIGIAEIITRIAVCCNNFARITFGDYITRIAFSVQAIP
jgi:hypothetical protein